MEQLSCKNSKMGSSVSKSNAACALNGKNEREILSGQYLIHMQNTSFHGKKVLVTGGSRGIGRAIVLAFADSGADVMINYVQNEDAANEVQTLAAAKGVQAYTFRANMGRPQAIKALFAEVKARFGTLDIVVHNAALGAFEPVEELSVFHWNVSLDTNARALLLCSQEATPLMEGRRGKIIGISSLGSHRYIPAYGAIGVSKAALETLIRYLAVELAPRGIQVNGVSGGLVDTDALRLHPQYGVLMQEGVGRTPAGRVGTPEDIANVVLFLASEQASWIYGQTIIADGGLDLL